MRVELKSQHCDVPDLVSFCDLHSEMEICHQGAQLVPALQVMHRTHQVELLSDGEE